MYEDAPISTYFFEYFPFSLISYRSAEVAAVFFPRFCSRFSLLFFSSFDSFLMKALGAPLAMRAIITAAAEVAEEGRKWEGRGGRVRLPLWQKLLHFHWHTQRNPSHSLYNSLGFILLFSSSSLLYFFPSLCHARWFHFAIC